MNVKNSIDLNNNNGAIIVKGNGFISFDGQKNVYPLYSSYGLPARFLRKVARWTRLYCVFPFFFCRWKKQIIDSSLVIMFDSNMADLNMVSRYIKKKNCRLKLVFWYWNPVKPNDVALKDKRVDEIWSYNRFDAKKYHLKYYPQFYHQILFVKNKKPHIDMVFLGRNKGRERSLTKLKETASAQGLKCKFIVADGKEKQINYKDYLKYVINSRCIVDLVPNQSCGLTLRPLEALFYEKKLVTNYEDIVNYDFYDKENIFIIGKDNINRLAEFVNSPYKKIDNKIVDFYSYESWLKRIKSGESVEL